MSDAVEKWRQAEADWNQAGLAWERVGLAWERAEAAQVRTDRVIRVIFWFVLVPCAAVSAGATLALVCRVIWQ
jgi:hypothetical protein